MVACPAFSGNLPNHDIIFAVDILSKLQSKFKTNNRV